MNEKTNSAVWGTIVIACIVFLGIFWIASDTPTPAEKALESEWCLVEYLSEGSGYFGSTGPGEDTYRIVQGDRGEVYVYQKCSKQ